jgi:hypothetical protein
VEVRLDGKVLFLVVPGDARTAARETPEDLANAASRALQTAWGEARERDDAGARLEGVLKVALATLLLLLALVVTLKLSSGLRRAADERLRRRLESLPGGTLGTAPVRLAAGDRFTDCDPADLAAVSGAGLFLPDLRPLASSR